MNIGIVCYPTFGGSGVVATELGMALADKGHKVHFITYQQPVRLNSFHKNAYFHEVRVSDYPLFEYPPYELVLASKIVDVVKYEKLDVLHVHYAIPHASSAYMAQQILRSENIDIPFVTTLHGTDITLVGKDPSFEPVISFAINESSAVTAVSDSLKKDTLDFFHVKREIEVIPNFINIQKMDKKHDHICHFRKNYADDDAFILTHISNFRKVKRIEDVVRVFAKVREQVKAKLILVGDGPERPTIDRLCRDVGVCPDTIKLGNVKNPTEVLHFSDLFILPSKTESFGLAALEAMAAGVPVISSNTGGLPEVNEHGYSGYLSDVGDVHSMAENALGLLQNPEKLKLFKQQAHKQAEKFDIANILPQYENLYNQLLVAPSP